MTVDELKELKRSRGFTNKEIAKLSGLPFGTVQKIFSGGTESPRRSTLLKLERLFVDTGNVKYDYTGDPGESRVSDVELAYASSVNEESGYSKQGSYTTDDYYDIRNDKRIELIDGVIYNMSTPSLAHQTALLEIAVQFYACAKEHPGCEVFISPVSVQLDRDSRTMIEPDMAVISDRDLMTYQCIFGAPDFVLEILSPSTKNRDLVIKLNKYWHAGCKEYWIVDTDNESVMAYDFDKDITCITHSFDETVPVGISNGECSIDFSVVRDKLKDYPKEDSSDK